MNGRWFLWVTLVAVWVGVLVLAPEREWVSTCEAGTSSGSLW